MSDGSAGLEQALDVVEHLPGFDGDIAGDEFLGGGIDRDLAGDEDEIAGAYGRGVGAPGRGYARRD